VTTISLAVAEKLNDVMSMMLCPISYVHVFWKRS